MLTISEVVSLTDPKKAALFLGAGSSIPSGAPSGAALAQTLWTRLMKTEPDSTDLMETCSILEKRFGRSELVKCVREAIRGVRPIGRIQELPLYDWLTIYTTNYDTLVEQAYAKQKRPIVPVLSNYDFGRLELSDGLPFFKLHGSIQHDTVDGHRARLVLTEADYDEYDRFRQSVYANLNLQLLTKDVIIVGYSLSDPHLKRSLVDAARIHKEQGATGRLYLIVFNKDENRARLWDDKGFFVAFGGLDDLIEGYSQKIGTSYVVEIPSTDRVELPVSLRGRTLVALDEAQLRPSATELYNGRPASYADIEAGLTFERHIENDIFGLVDDESKYFVSMIGVGGVGKTSLARRLLVTLGKKGWGAWEHKADSPFRAADWLQVNDVLVARDFPGVLLVDDCTQFLGQVNELADRLSAASTVKLKLLLTAARANWTPRVKSPKLFQKGTEVVVSELGNKDIEELLRLLERSEEIRSLVSADFLRTPPREKYRRLRERCSADMYVCLKNIFATEGLDSILLREMAGLADYQREVYSMVCFLQASLEHVHRQLILRLLGVVPDRIQQLLRELEGLVNEYGIQESQGIYGWSTRHPIIAETITRYEYSQQASIVGMFDRIVERLLPTVPIELMAIRSLCNSSFGLFRIDDHNERIRLYRKLIEIAPAERIPHHRLIGTLLQLDDLDGADYAIRVAEDLIGEDRPVARYKVRLLIRRAVRTEGILREHRVAMLRNAESEALRKLEKYPLDKHLYTVYGEVGVAMAETDLDVAILDDAIARMKEAAAHIMDTDMLRDLTRLENERKRFRRQSGV